MVPAAGSSTWLEEPTLTQGRYHSGVCLTSRSESTTRRSGGPTWHRGQSVSDRDAHRLVVSRSVLAQTLDGLRLLSLFLLHLFQSHSLELCCFFFMGQRAAVVEEIRSWWAPEKCFLARKKALKTLDLLLTSIN